MPVKIAGAVAFGGVSFYLFRAAVRALRIEEPDTRKDKGLLALLNLIAGVCLTLLPFYISFWHLLFSYEFPGSYYWWAIEGGGKAVALSAIPCWFWWGTVIAAQACARRQKYFRLGSPWPRCRFGCRFTCLRQNGGLGIGTDKGQAKPAPRFVAEVGIIR